MTIIDPLDPNWVTLANIQLSESLYVYLPPGAYTLAPEEGLVVPAGATLEGTPGTRITKAGGPDKVPAIKVAGSGTTVRNLSIQDFGSMQVGSIEVRGSQVRIQGIKAKGGYSGVWVQDGQNIFVEDCDLSFSAHPLYIGDVQESPSHPPPLEFVPQSMVMHLLISRCLLHNSLIGGDGLKLAYRCKYITVKDCIIFDNVQDGIDCFASGDHLMIQGCHIYGNGAQGVDIKTATVDCPPHVYGSTQNITVQDCFIRANGRYGVKVWRSHPSMEPLTPRNILIQGCHISENFVGAGGTGDDIKVLSCTIEDNIQRGVFFLGYADKVLGDHYSSGGLVKDCLIRNNGLVEVTLSYTKGARVLNCHIGDARDEASPRSEFGIGVFSAEVWLEGNKVDARYSYLLHATKGSVGGPNLSAFHVEPGKDTEVKKKGK